MADDIAAVLVNGVRWIDRAIDDGRRAGLEDVDMASQMLVRTIRMWMDNHDEDEDAVRAAILSAVDFHLGLMKLKTPEEALALFERQLKEYYE